MACSLIASLPLCRQELAAAVAAESLRPIMAADMPPELGCLLEAAWQLHPGQRPTATQLEAKLQSLVDQLEKSSTEPSLSAEQKGTAVSHVKTGKQVLSGLLSVTHLQRCYKHCASTL